MNGSSFDGAFAAAVRDELVAVGSPKGRLRRRQRRTRIAAFGVAAALLAAATTGAALLLATRPGETTVTPVGAAVSAVRTGTSTVDLGPAPRGAASVLISVTCLDDSGTLSVPSTNGFSESADGTTTPLVGGVDWDCATRRTPVEIRHGYLAPGATSITVTASPGTSWKAIAQYATEETSEWEVNARGQTYGVPNARHGYPDLEGARATNGALGYISVKEFDAVRGDGCIDVVESDGTTVIGRFAIGESGCAG